MIAQNSYPDNYSPYPGEYIPFPLALDELLDELGKQHEGTTIPLVNIVEFPDFFTVEIAVPGLKKEDFHVSINGSTLSIYVLHKEPEEHTKVYLQHDFNYCCFKKDINLPDKFITEFLYARYCDGILSISLPKANEPLIHHGVTRIMVY
jgi:HSP20 family protein